MKKNLIKTLFLSGILLALAACSGGGTSSSSSTSETSSGTSSSVTSVNPEDEPELPEGTAITVYLVLSKIGLYEGQAGENIEAYHIENAIAYDTKVGDALPGADKITSTSGATFVSWVKYDGNGAPTKYEKAPNKNHQILYVNWTGGSGGGGGGGGGSNVPTSGFHVKVTSGTTVSYYVASDTGTESYGKHVYATAVIALKANDTFCMFDGSTGSSFNCKDASTLYLGTGIESSAFTYSASAVTVNTAGNYYIELQLAYEDNSYYIHL